jgi:hypothetical protein
MVTQYDAQEVQIQANANLIAELKRFKGEVEDTLEKNEAYCHQWGAHLATAYRHVLECFGAETQEFKITNKIGSFVQWLNSGLNLLSDTMSKVGDMGQRRALRRYCTFWNNKVVSISKPSRAEIPNSPPLRTCQPRVRLLI